MGAIKKHPLFWTIPLLWTLLPSCVGDCTQVVSGTVLDKVTKQPVDCVFVYKEHSEVDTTYTNKEGKFKISSISGGLWGCPPMKVGIMKRGYNQLSTEINAGGSAIIYLTRSK